MNCELLAPAGNIECVYAAVNSGADAVYAGCDRFSARAYAGNLSIKEYITAIERAHLHDVKMYLTLNTLIGTSELEDAYNIVRPLYESGLDGVIVQDLGIADMLFNCFPHLKLHASTQMSIINAHGAALLKDHGFERIVPARELTLDEAVKIKKNTGLEIECFIHGAMCYSYSGMCLMSSVIGERSGNRGRCAGTCRLPFAMIEKENGHTDEYPLSMKDMCTLDILPDLIDAGIDSFKIEGRMKSPEYVAGVTAMYRKYMDMYTESGRSAYKIAGSDREKLSSLYIRTEISRGYYEGYKGRDLITLDHPGYNGNDPGYEKEIHDKYVHDCVKTDADMYVYLHENEPAILSLNMDDISVSVTGDTVSEAIKAPLDENTVREKMCRTGETPFSVSGFIADIGENAFIPVGALNALRRSGFAALAEEITARKGYRDFKEGIRNYDEYAGSLIDREKAVTSADKDTGRHVLYDISVCTPDQIDSFLCFTDSLKERGIDALPGRLIIDYSLLLTAGTKIEELSDRVDNEIYVSFPYVFRDVIVRGKPADNKDAGPLYDELCALINENKYILGVVVHGLDELEYVSGRLKDIGIITDTGVYVHNPASFSFLKKENISGFTYPYELNRKDLTALSEEITDTGIEKDLVVYGYIPMMVSAGCVKKTYGICDHEHGLTGSVHLKDRKGIVFPVVPDCLICANIIYNERPLSLYGMIDDICHIKADRYRICLTVEDKESAETVLDAYICRDTEAVNRLKSLKTTTGHMKRGAL